MSYPQYGIDQLIGPITIQAAKLGLLRKPKRHWSRHIVFSAIPKLRRDRLKRLEAEGYQAAVQETERVRQELSLAVTQAPERFPSLKLEYGLMVSGINSRSLREPEITIPKPHGLYRVVVLGDSIPWDRGGFVELMSARRADQPQFEIINASIPGYTSYQELVFFKRYLLNAEPDVVIWSYCLNDNHKFLSQFDEKGRMLLTPEAEETLTIHNKWEFLVSHSYLLSSLWFRIVALRQQYRNQNRSEFVWEKLADFNVAWKEVYWSSYEKYVSEMLHLLNERNAKLAIVVFPFEPQLNYRHDAANYDYAVKPQRILQGICEKYHIPCLDLYPSFSSAYDEGQKFYRDGIHLNNAGHRLTASTIERFVKAN